MPAVSCSRSIASSCRTPEAAAAEYPDAVPACDSMEAARLEAPPLVEASC